MPTMTQQKSWPPTSPEIIAGWSEPKLVPGMVYKTERRRSIQSNGGLGSRVASMSVQDQAVEEERDAEVEVKKAG